LTITGAAHTGITAATEDIGVNFNFSATKTWAAGAGPLATQREVFIQGPTYAGDAGGALTITDAYTLYVDDPVQGANMTLTRPWVAGFAGNVGFGAGTETLPSMSFLADPNTGFYSFGANQIGVAIDGSAQGIFSSSGLQFDQYTTFNNTYVTLKGNDANDASGIAVVINAGTALTTAGAKLLSMQNNIVEKAYIDLNGGFVTTAGRMQQRQGADVASANDMVLGTDGNVFEITGVTQINHIANTSWQEGSVITLVFNESVTVDHANATSGANITILLAGSADFLATANDTLTLCLCSTTAGGQAWREMARTAV